MSERWDQISEIFERALELDPEARGRFVKERCGTDDQLRQEVDALIQSHEEADDKKFIDSPAVEKAAPFVSIGENDSDQTTDRLEAGQIVGHYQAIEKIGAGGMGEVYLAKDTRLDRMVALKILPADLASDQRRMLRFKQEARIVSALNQPNILTIYEFGEVGEHHFLASEYVDGETLRSYLSTRKLKLHETLDIIIQVTAALDAAHEAKIVHRDIKPENIMIRRRDHVVKVLDFGLAKLTEKNAPGQSTDTEAATAVLLKTIPGSVMGTINYMSPEQAQGLKVDERTDIWSTGVVLYEMITGRIPFRGRTSSHTVVEILEREPASLLKAGAQKIPAELERIVSKALTKNPEERYQTAKDLKIDLKNLRRRLEVESELERSKPNSYATPDEAAKPQKTSEQLAISTAELSRFGNTHAGMYITAGLAIIALVIGTYIWRSWQVVVPATLPPPTEVAPKRELRYWITVQKYRNGKPFESPFQLAREINFERDYQVRLHVSSPQMGHLYVLNESPGSAKNWSILFPSPTSNNGSSYIPENQEIRIPDPSWIVFDDARGTEKLWLIWSANAVAELEAIRQFANPSDKGVISSPELSRKAQEFIKANSAEASSIVKDKTTNVTGGAAVVVHLIPLEHN